MNTKNHARVQLLLLCSPLQTHCLRGSWTRWWSSVWPTSTERVSWKSKVCSECQEMWRPSRNSEQHSLAVRSQNTCLVENGSRSIEVTLRACSQLAFVHHFVVILHQWVHCTLCTFLGIDVNLEEVLDPHTVCGLLKLHLRELRVSLIPRGPILTELIHHVKQRDVSVYLHGWPHGRECLRENSCMPYCTLTGSNEFLKNLIQTRMCSLTF